MLKQLKIQNYALIESLDIQWMPGLTAMTGETGSGKSIVLGALGLLLGQRTDASAVRSGQDKCSVEGVFQATHDITTWLEDNDLDAWEEVIIRRELTIQGRSRAFIKDTPVKASDLQSIGNLLVDLHGQDGTKLLTRRDFQIEWVDSHANHEELVDRYHASFQAFSEAQSMLSELELQKSKPQTDLDYIQYQLKELHSLDLDKKDWNALSEEQEILENSTEIKDSLYSAWASINESEKEASVIDRLKYAQRALEKISTISPSYGGLFERIQAVHIELNDIVYELDAQADAVDHDPQRLAELQEIQNELQRMLFKHNAPDAEALKSLEISLKELISEAATVEERYLVAKEHLKNCRTEMLSIGSELLESRKRIGALLIEQVQEKLKALSIAQGKLEFNWTLAEEPDYWGIEQLEILFSANPGHPLLPIQKVASGGEKSRLMLAIKATSGQRDRIIPTIILDEIDTGVSGRVAKEMASMMRKMAESQQVISVTHLPQVAGSADHHMRVSKSIQESVTNTHVHALDKTQRLEELAGMLSGSEITSAALENAAALLMPSD
ncbi:MAG: DNA repair protein RecN [Flavobacteriales bacterium]